jgi:hypothetical protein
MAKNPQSGWDSKVPNTSPYGPGSKTPASGQYANNRASRSAKKDYGHGLPPAGPSNYIVTTPNFLPFGSDDDSK